MNKENASVFKRGLAYIIDFVIVLFISSIISSALPTNKKYEEVSQKQIDILEKYQNKELTSNEALDQINELQYYSLKYCAKVTLINCGVTLIYFVGIAYIMKGQTIGKKIVKIRIVSKDGQTLKIYNYVLRSIFINRILADLVITISVIALSKAKFNSIYSPLNNVFTIIWLTCITFAFWRTDGRGLHDLLANTKVVNDCQQNLDKENKGIQEASYEEKVENEENKENIIEDIKNNLSEKKKEEKVKTKKATKKKNTNKNSK